MRPTRISLNTIGYAPPILLDWYQSPVNASLAITLSSGATLTASAYFSCDDLSPTAVRAPAAVTRTGSTITVTGDYGLPGSGVGGPPDGGTHGLSVGDYVQLLGDQTLNGNYNVASVVSATSYTLTSPVAGSYAGVPGIAVRSARLFLHGTLQNLTARSMGNISWPVSAVWLNISAYTSGVATMAVMQGGLR